MLMSVPEPLMRPFGDQALSGGQQTIDQHGFVEPCGQNAIQHRQFNACLINAERFEVRLVIESAGGVVVRRAIASRDVERHVETASNFIQDLTLKLRVSTGGLNDCDLPAAFSNL
jgi:hypothetical protein